jgi:hypothetical protein
MDFGEINEQDWSRVEEGENESVLESAPIATTTQ